MIRNFFLLFFILCLVSAAASCSGAASGTETLPTPSSQPEIYATPDLPGVQAELRVRPIDGMTVVYLPGGDFLMGSTEPEIEAAIALCKQHYSPCNHGYYEREGPQHPVSLNDYWFDQSEVSNAQYQLCVDAGICSQPVACQKGQPTFNDPEKAAHPVVCVDWENAQTYCQWVGGRLPTEAEWEYAFRGQAGSIFPWGDEFDGARLNYCDTNCSQPHADHRFNDGYPMTGPVGSYPSGVSWSGAYNMSGNVSEWVADWFGDYEPDAVSNPSGPQSGREKMLKGCSWYFNPAYCRGALRPSVNPDTRFDYLGFRCAMPVEPENQEGETAMSTEALVLPQGEPPALDGTLSPGEWEQAATETFADGSQLFLMQNEEFLYVGIQANQPGTIAGNVFIQRGDEISILHASAALGTAVYQKSEDSWQQIQDFNWRCRSTAATESALAERADFLQDEGWLAANGWMGTPNELEYKIKISEQDLRLAVVFTRSTPPYEKIPWPADLDDDCITPTPGGFPMLMEFSTGRWGVLRPMNSD